MLTKIRIAGVIVILGLTWGTALGQGVGINEDNSDPDASAMLDVKSSTKGILIPRLTSSERIAILNPAKGLLVFDNDNNAFWFFNGTSWQQIGAASGSDDQQISITGTIITLEDGGSIDIGAVNTDNQQLTLAGTTLQIADGNSVDLAAIDTDDQLLSYDNTTGELTISDGNTIVLPLSSGGDNWGSQVVVTDATLAGSGTSGDPLKVAGVLTDDQTLTLAGTSLTIEDGNTIDLSAIDTDTDDQTLSFDNTTGDLTISEGNTVTLPVSTGGDNWGSQVAETDGTTITGNGTSADPLTVNGDLTDDQDISLTGTQLSITDGSTIDLAGIDTDTDDQTLTLTGTDLAIADGNTVDLSGLQDGTGTDDQQLTLTGTSLTIEDGNTIDLSVIDTDTDTDDQTLTLTGTDLSIEDGNTIDLSAIDTDTDDQTLTLTGTDLSISEGNTVDLSGLQDGTGTDDQQLTLTGTNLSIEDGNTIDLSGVDTDTDDQTLTLAGTDLSISEGNMVDLSGLQDGTGTDDQQLTLTGTSLSIEDGNTVDLSGIDTDTDDQTLTLTGTNLSIVDGNTVDLSSLQDGVGTDDQVADAFFLSGTNLELSLENDGEPNKIVDLSSIDTDTDDQTLSLSGTDLSIEDGNVISLSSINTDDQTIDALQFDGSNLEISLENDGVANYSVDLSSLAGTQDKIEDADTDTKIQVEESADEDYIRFDVAGNEVAVINNSGQVGIGTNQPSQLLEIKSQTNGLNTPLLIRNNDATETGGNAVGIGFHNEAASGRAPKGAIVMERTASYGRGNFHFLLENTNSEQGVTLADAKMTITKEGNVGIGETDPKESLHVAGNIRMVDGNQAMGKVMVSDANGTASWTDVTALGVDHISDADNDTKIQVEESADEDKIRFDLGAKEYFVMNGPRLEVNNSGYSVFIGENAGLNDDLTANGNVALGYNALKSNISQGANVAIGKNALSSATGGYGDVAIGGGAMQNNLTGDINVVIGSNAAYNATSGDRSVILGAGALGNSTTPNNTVAIGFNANNNATDGDNSVVIGYRAGPGSGVSSTGNIFIGSQAGNAETGNNRLYIENSSADADNALIYGEFDNDLLAINGTLRINDGTQASGYVLTSNASGNASWADPSTVGTDDQTIDVFQFDGTSLEISLENDGMANYSVNLSSLAGTQDKIEDADADTKIQVEESADEDYIRFDVAGKEAMVIDNNGNSGFGTSSPDTTIHIVGKLKYQDGSQADGYVLTSDADGNASWQASSSTSLIADSDGDTKIEVEQSSNENVIHFSTNGSEAMKITNLGQVGILTDPTENFSVSMGDASSSATISQTSWTSGDGGGSTTPRSQTFTATVTAELDKIELATPNGGIIITLYEGTISGGTILGTATVGGGSATWKAIYFTGVTLQAGQVYTIAASDNDNWFYSTSNPYSGGSASQNSNYDFAFKVYTKVNNGVFSVGSGGVTINDYTLPVSDGNSSQVLSTDGSGTVQWEDVSNLSTTNWTLSGNDLYNNNSGYVGIGTSSPNYQLHVNGSSTYSYLQFTNTVTGTTQDDGFIIGNGFDGAANIIQREAQPLKFSTSNTERMRIDANGNVGIGTTPSRAKLEVSGAGSSTNLATYGYYSYNGSNTNLVNGSNQFSIYADGRIAGYVLYAHSDRRIKNIIGVSNATNDLETLKKIRITDYTYKDSVAHGMRPQKKVIAQELEQVYPQAVDSTTTEVVPDIYQMATIKDGWVSLSTNLKAGETVQLILKDGQKLFQVEEVNKNGFRVASQTDGDVFVYGRQVNNFRTVDYDAVSMLNVSATQELARQVSDLQKKLKLLQEENKTLKTELAEEKFTNQERLDKIEAALGIGMSADASSGETKGEK